MQACSISSYCSFSCLYTLHHPVPASSSSAFSSSSFFFSCTLSEPRHTFFQGVTSRLAKRKEREREKTTTHIHMTACVSMCCCVCDAHAGVCQEGGVHTGFLVHVHVCERRRMCGKEAEEELKRCGFYTVWGSKPWRAQRWLTSQAFLTTILLLYLHIQQTGGFLQFYVSTQCIYDHLAENLFMQKKSCQIFQLKVKRELKSEYRPKEAQIEWK